MKTENESGARERRKRTPRAEIITHLAWWWMGSLTPSRYAKAHGIEPAALERWMRAHLIFRPGSGGRKGPDLGKSRSKAREARTEFVGMTVAGEDSPC